jgi:putative ABC transport system permease protein
MYALKILINQKLRLFLTVGGISLCVILMLFLLGIYRGVADGSVEYIQKNDVDLWVLQKSCTNILRGTSLLSAYQQTVIQKDENVQLVTPVLLILSTLKFNNRTATTFLTGYIPKNKYGGPPELIKGRTVKSGNEVVLDRSFAKKYKLNIGDSLSIQDKNMRVVGLSSGTNAFVIQYSFTTLDQAESIIGFPGIVTGYLIKLKNGSDRSKAAIALQKKLPGTIIYDQSQFLKNNIKEMESGFLPILFAVAVISGIVLTVILSLILTINTLERQKDFAVMKTLGAPNGFLPKLVIQQSFIIISMSLISGVILFFPLVGIIENLSPEVSTKTSLLQIIFIIVAAALMSLISSLAALQRLRKIYPLEAFK